MSATMCSHMVCEHEIATMDDGNMKLDRRFEETMERSCNGWHKKMVVLLKEKVTLKWREAELDRQNKGVRQNILTKSPRPNGGHLKVTKMRRGRCMVTCKTSWKNMRTWQVQGGPLPDGQPTKQHGLAKQLANNYGILPSKVQGASKSTIMTTPKIQWSSWKPLRPIWPYMDSHE